MCFYFILFYEHDNVRITKEETIVALVIRVSPHVCMCNVATNIVVLADTTIQSIMMKELKGKVNMEQRQIQYDMLDINSYHEKIIAKFKNLTSIN